MRSRVQRWNGQAEPEIFWAAQFGGGLASWCWHRSLEQWRKFPLAGVARLLRRRPKFEVASLRRRFAASLLNLLVGISALVSVVAAGVGIFRVGRKGRVNLKLIRGLASRSARIPAQLQSEPAKRVLPVVVFAASALRKERRGAGFRLLGLRLVDARTGRDVSRGQELVRAGTRQAWRLLCRRLIPVRKAQASPTHKKIRSDVEFARRRYANDQQAMQREVMRIYQENKMEPVRMSFLPVLLRFPLIAVIDLPMFWSPLKQSLPDRLSGTVIARDRAPRRHR